MSMTWSLWISSLYTEVGHLVFFGDLHVEREGLVTYHSFSLLSFSTDFTIHF